MPSVITLSGPSGSGKTYLASQLLAMPGYERLITCTTRAKRQQEVNGQDYHFYDQRAFQEDVAKGLFIETNQFNNNWYGSRFSDMKAALYEGGPNIVVAIEPNGAYALAKWGAENGITVANVYIDCPRKLLLERLISRIGEDKAETVAERIFKYQDEERHWKTAMNYAMRINAANSVAEGLCRIRDIECHLDIEHEFPDTKRQPVWRGLPDPANEAVKNTFISKVKQVLQSDITFVEKTQKLLSLSDYMSQLLDKAPEKQQSPACMMSPGA